MESTYSRSDKSLPLNHNAETDEQLQIDQIIYKIYKNHNQSKTFLIRLTTLR